jgi:ComF family protein
MQSRRSIAQPRPFSMISWICHWHKSIRGMAAACGRLLFPPRCVQCGQELFDEVSGDILLCSPCLAMLAPADWHSCHRCGGQIFHDVTPEHPCPHCHNVPLQFDTVISLGSYHSGLQGAILLMKHPINDPLSNAVGRLLAHRRREQILDVRADLIMPIPMHWSRRLRRGKNCPEVLADCLSQSLSTPVRRGILVRCRNTKPQSSLPPSERLRNMRGAFRVRHPKLVRDARVLLVDDALTTGATCSEAAKVLKKAGATMVAVAVVARTGKP